MWSLFLIVTSKVEASLGAKKWGYSLMSIFLLPSVPCKTPAKLEFGAFSIEVTSNEDICCENSEKLFTRFWQSSNKIAGVCHPATKVGGVHTPHTSVKILVIWLELKMDLLPIEYCPYAYAWVEICQLMVANVRQQRFCCVDHRLVMTCNNVACGRIPLTSLNRWAVGNCLRVSFHSIFITVWTAFLYKRRRRFSGLDFTFPVCGHIFG